MNSKRMIIALVIALVATNLLWLYVTLDNGVTRTHQSDELGYNESTINMLSELVVMFPKDMDQGRTVEWLKSHFPDKIVKVEGDTVELENIRIEYKAGKLVRVIPF